MAGIRYDAAVAYWLSQRLIHVLPLCPACMPWVQDLLGCMHASKSLWRLCNRSHIGCLIASQSSDTSVAAVAVLLLLMGVLYLI